MSDMNLLRTLQKKTSAKAISMVLVTAMLFGALPAPTASVVNAEADPEVKSPIYNDDGSVTINLVTDKSSAQIKGAYSNDNWTPVNMNSTTQEQDGFKGYTYTISANLLEDAGLYEYGMTDGSEDNFVGDPLSETKKGNNGIIVRNPIIENGVANIYMPSKETVSGNVYYRAANDSSAEWATASFAAADEYTGLYVAAISNATVGTEYEYKIGVSENGAVYDSYNFASRETDEETGDVTTYFKVDSAAIEEPNYTSPVIDAKNGTVTFNYWNPNAETVHLYGSMNSWSKTANSMTKNDNGLFTITLNLEAGEYSYQFVIDGGDGVIDAKNSNKKDNGFGGYNSVVVVPEKEGEETPKINTNLTIHFQSPETWKKVYSKFGETSDWDAIAGYEYCKNQEFGAPLYENEKNSGWYSFNITKTGNKEVDGLFNNGSWGDDNQTSNFAIKITKEAMEVWITVTDDGLDISEEAPENWETGAEIGKPSTVDSPVINDDGTITFNFKLPASDTSDKVYLMGTLTDWDNGKEMTYDAEKGVYTTQLTLKPGKYEYKFKTSGGAWYQDPLNPLAVDDTRTSNSIVRAPGLALEADNIAGLGPVTVNVDIPSNVTISDNSVLEWSIEAVEATKTVTPVNDIKKLHITPITDEEKPSAQITADNDLSNGYFKVVLKYGDTEDEVTELQLYHTKKAYLYEYEYTADSEYVGQSDIYVWYNSQASNVGYSLRSVNGKNIAYITIDDTTTNFGYIARLYGSWGNNDRLFTDRTLFVNTDDLYTKVKGVEDQKEVYLLPSGKTSYDNGIVFAYRDDELFYNNEMTSKLGDKEVKVLYKLESETDYKELTMNYSDLDELFTASVSANELEEGIYDFKFNVDGTEVQDQYMGGKIEFKKPQLDINAVVTPEEADYDMNPVVNFDISYKDTNEAVTSDVISAITADLSVLGYNAEVSFSATNFDGVLYIDRGVKPGTYDVPFVITDAWGNTHEIEVPVKVVARTASTPSWDESSVYFLLTDRFADGDETNNYDVDKTKIESYHGGDFKGLTSKLSYIQNLGVNTIWITPIVDNIDEIHAVETRQQAYHGYWAKDFTKIDEHLGTTEDLDTLIDEAAKRGIRVMVDIVVNHAGYGTKDSENFKGMLRTDEEMVPGDVILGELSDLPDFKTEQEDVRAKLVAWQTAWANHETPNGNRIAYFRVDTVKHVEHDTWQELKTSIAKVNPAFKMIGEYFGASYTNTGDYLGNGQMDALLDFDFKSQAGDFVNGKLDQVEEALEARNAGMSSSLTMGQFLGSHDEDGFLATTAGNDLGKLRVAAALQLTAKGIPVIYYGEEINLSGPDGYGVQDNNRYEMQFDNLSDDQKATLAHYQKLLAARNLYLDVFATGNRTKVVGSDKDGYIVFKRSTTSESVWVGLNTTAQAKEVTFSVSGNDVEALYDVYNDQVVTVSDNSVTVTIPSKNDGGTVILAVAKELSGIKVDAPYKTSYYIGEDLDLSGLVVTGQYGDSKAVIASGYEVDSSKYNKDAVGTYEITVSYGGFTQSFNVTVAEKPVDATPVQPTQPETPTQPQPQTPAQPTAVEVTGITLSETSATLEKGKTLTLTATVAPAEATDKTVTFTSSDEKVAAVTAEGVVTAVDKGTATITAKAANGKSAECQITVTIPATKVYLNQSFTIKKGQTKTLTATLAPADSTDKITWKSSNTKKVTVDQNGKIKAVAAGSAKITATSDSGKKATCTVTVAAKAVKATKVTIAKTSNTMKVGDVKQLKVTVKPAKTTDAVTFKSSKKAVVSVANNGVLTAKKAGSATITVKAGKKKATIKITVSAPATAIKLNKTTATIKKGKTLKLKATLTPKGCNDTLKFKSSKASVASVDSKGVVKGKKKGTATITVTTGSGKKATCKVTVK